MKSKSSIQSPIIKITRDTTTDEANESAEEITEQNQDCITSSAQPDEKPDNRRVLVVEEQTHAYKRRFFVLFLFCAHSAINSFQWIQYSSITSVISDFYGATNIQVNWTSIIYMVTYIPFIIHASLMLEKVGLRKAILIGTIGTALGSLVKYQLGSSPGMNSFWWMMAGQTIVALSQLYIISIPPLLAAVWFPDNQVSTATGIGVFGNQLGIALGFIVPPYVISDNKASKDVIGTDLNCLHASVFWISFIICLTSMLTLEDKPPKPPGSASYHAAHQIETDQEKGETGDVKTETFATIRELCRDVDFGLLILSYGINVGCFYAVSTVLNQMVERSGSTDMIDLAGKLGLLLVLSGMAGSVLCGQLLDRFHAYKLIIVFIYLFSLLSMLLFTLVLEIKFNGHWSLYIAAIILGFFMTGYLPLGFEFAAEITYPHPANTPAGLLNLSAQVSRKYSKYIDLNFISNLSFFSQVFGLILTYAASPMVDNLGNIWANSFLTFCLTIGLILTLIMKADLKRQKAVKEEQIKF